MEIVGDGVDNDCDGFELCYADGDVDGFGAAMPVESAGDVDCTDPGEAAEAGDCDDSDSTFRPNVAEIAADGADQNCDDIEVCYVDVDGDGYGTPTVVTSEDLTCTAAGLSPLATDCDDTVELGSLRSPGLAEVPADGLDQDCDDLEACYADADQDGYGGSALVDASDLDCVDPGESVVGSDCDDATATTHPEAEEHPGDEVDGDCDAHELCYVDADGDTYGDVSGATVWSTDIACSAAGEAKEATDCADEDGARFPGVDEIVADGIDQDCSGGDLCFVDADEDTFGGMEADDVADTAAPCPSAERSIIGGDCDDGDGDIHPDAVELPADTVDQNCDAVELCYLDVDVDGYGGPALTDGALGCEGAGTSAFATDCADDDALVSPLASERCNGIDDDCDGARDEDFPYSDPNRLDCDDTSGPTFFGCAQSPSRGGIAGLLLLAIRRPRPRAIPDRGKPLQSSIF
jgi:hypothetical protein